MAYHKAFGVFSSRCACNFLDESLLNPNWDRVTFVRQTRKRRNNISGDVDRLVEVESFVVVTTDNKFYSGFLCPTEVGHQWGIRVLENATVPDFFRSLCHLTAFICPFLNFSLEFLKGTLLDFCILDVLQSLDQWCVFCLEFLCFSCGAGDFRCHDIRLVGLVTGFVVSG